MIAALCVFRFGLTVRCLRNTLFLWCLLGAAVTDFRRSVIPAGFPAAGIAVWAVCLPFIPGALPDAPKALFCAAFFFAALFCLALFSERIFRKQVLGGGDVKLFSVSALYTGFSGTVLTLLFSCVIGLFAAAVIRKKGKDRFPFGPAIALSAGTVLLFREPLLKLLP